MSIAAATMILAAAPFADLDAIVREVAAYTGAAIGETGGAMQPVDRRLRLMHCLAPLALAWRGQARDTVVVDCPDLRGWRLFVPVKSAAPGAGASAAISRGDVISISVMGPGFTVTRPGEAMESGAPGAWIRVRPADGTARGGEPLRARVIRPGLAGVPLP